jgi:hypothetical protein
MQNSNKIRRFSAAFFLILFSFCITPKRFLHDLLAHHKDTRTETQKTALISTTGFHCHADDLVVVEPFIPEIQNYTAPVLLSGVFTFKSTVASLVYIYLSRSDNRGPPAFTIS